MAEEKTRIASEALKSRKQEIESMSKSTLREAKREVYKNLTLTLTLTLIGGEERGL